MDKKTYEGKGGKPFIIRTSKKKRESMNAKMREGKAKTKGKVDIIVLEKKKWKRQQAGPP